MAIHLCHTLNDRLSTHLGRPSHPSIYEKLLALVRSISYRRLSGSALNWLGLPLNGMLIILISSVLFVVALTFAIRPYYRAHLGYGSPPLGIRCGFMSFACTPILIALAGKANVITLLTGISHEKLNVVHRWVAWITLGLAWVHTIPFFWISYTNGGAANVATQFFMGTTGRTEVKPSLTPRLYFLTKQHSGEVSHLF